MTARDAVRTMDAIAVMGLAPVLEGRTKEAWAANVLATTLQHRHKIRTSILTAKRRPVKDPTSTIRSQTQMTG